MKNTNRQLAVMFAGTETKIFPGQSVGNINPYVEWIKWLSYTPEFEKNRIEKLSEKTAGELSILELNELKNYLFQNRMVNLFKIYGTEEISKSQYMEVYDYMCENSIDELMLSKLSKEELKYANSVIEQFAKLPKDELCNKVHREQKEDVYLSLSMVDSYILHILSKLNFSRSMSNLDREIAIRFDESAAMRQRNYCYASNPHKRK